MRGNLSDIGQRPALFGWLTPSVLFLSFIVTLRNGINFWGYDYYAIDWSKHWPQPLSVFSVENSGDLALAHFLKIDTRIEWFLLHLFLTFLFFALIIYFVNKEIVNNIQKRHLFLVLLATPLSMMIMQEIGYFDVVTILGAIILANSNRLPFALLGAAVMSAGNTPQAMIAIFIFSLSLYCLRMPLHKNVFFHSAPFLVVVLIWIGERFWLNGTGRTEEFGPSMWSYSFKGFLIASPLFLYVLLGPLVVLLPKIHTRIKASSNPKELWVWVFVVVVPGIFGVVTTESTRDALCIMAPTILWLLRREIVIHKLVLSRWEIAGIVLLPSFLIWRQGESVEPWSILRRTFF